MITTRQLGGLGVSRLLDATPDRYMREAAASRALAVYSEDWAGLLHQRIREIYKHESVRAELRKFASCERNLLRRVTEAVSVAYNQPPRRLLRDMGEDAERALQTALVDEGEIDVLAEEWARLAFILGVVHVVPVVRDEERYGARRLSFDTILPHAAETVMDSAGYPSILVYGVDEGDATRVALDGESWTYYDAHWAEVRRVDHGLGRCPAVQFRVRRNIIDYWDRRAGDRLVSATLEVARIAAHKSWIRKCSSSKLATFFAEDLSEGSEGPFTAEQGLAKPIAPGDVSFTVHDYVTPVDQFILEIKDIVEDVAESFGIPSTRVDPVAGQAYSPAEHAAIAKLRAGQIKHLARAEKELAITSVEIMRALGHPLAGNLDPDAVRVAYHVEFPPLTYVDDPQTALAVSNERVKQAQSNQVEEYMTTHPGVTWDEAHAAVLRNIEVRGEITKYQATHGIDNDPRAQPRDDADSVSQRQGREGGRMAPSADEEEDDQ